MKSRCAAGLMGPFLGAALAASPLLAQHVEPGREKAEGPAHHQAEHRRPWKDGARTHERNAAAADWNPNGLAAAVRTPFAEAAETASAEWCAPQHWRPWGGDWSCDFWADNGQADIDYTLSCGKDVWLKVSPWVLPGGVLADSMRAKVVEQGYACASAVLTDGGYYQKYEIYGTYRGVEVDLGWVVVAHLDQPVYATDTWIGDPMNVRIGTVYKADHTSKCWGSCHIHMEVYTNSPTNGACYFVTPDEPGLGPRGKSSIAGVVGGNLGPGGQSCPVCTHESQLACSTWDADLQGCDAHGNHNFGATQDCAYYFCSSKCRARGTSNCEAGCQWYCGQVPSESQPCSTYDSADNDPTVCDRHQYGQTQDCAFYFCSHRCRARGTSNCEAGCGGECSSCQ